ncbi:MAG TPA: phosphate signaling complex protein PhoU [Spirochaetota bacterium]
MTTHLQMELEHIKSRLFEMADRSIEAITKSVDALKSADLRQAANVIKDDTFIDELEKIIDEECVRILVTRQPAAVDLRFVLSMLKINTDLERIGDLATTIAKQVIVLEGKMPVKPLIDIPRMTDLAIAAIKDSLAAIAEWDSEKAKGVIARDHEIDELNIQVFRELLTIMAEFPTKISDAFALIMVARSLERIGDHATNIAERAVYYIEGIDIRHTL